MGGESKTDAEKGDSAAVHIPVMQRILDSPYLLLFLGVTVPTVFYVLWGLMEIAQMPIAK